MRRSSTSPQRFQATLAQGGIKAEVITGSGDQIYGAMRERKFELIVGRGGGGQLPHPDFEPARDRLQPGQLG